MNIPVVADIDTAYGNAINAMRTIREFEAAIVAAVIMEDQVSPKRCPICVGGVEVMSMEEGISKIEAAVAARRNPDMLIIARTDVVDEEEAIGRAKAYVAAGADVIQPISKCFNSIEGLRALRRECGVPLSLQLLGWLERDLAPTEIEECRRHRHLSACAADERRRGAAGEPQGSGQVAQHQGAAAAGHGA